MSRRRHTPPGVEQATAGQAARIRAEAARIVREQPELDVTARVLVVADLRREYPLKGIQENAALEQAVAYLTCEEADAYLASLRADGTDWGQPHGSDCQCDKCLRREGERMQRGWR